ncbi:MAG: SH3 domain-containing protein [Anaerolineae bacterium]|nr:SH3 domain-containing protein [Anaerolineae bacterium]
MKKLILVFTFVALFASAFGAFAQAQYAAPIAVVNTGNLNVRSGPGPQFSVITTVPGGAQLPVLGFNEDASWYLVTTPAGNGWIYAAFTVGRGDFRFVPVVNIQVLQNSAVNPNGTLAIPGGAGVVTAPIPELDPGRVVVNTGNLNVRSGPGPQFSILGSVPGGTVLPVDGVTPDNAWFLVSSPFGAGWVDGEFTVFRGSIASVPIFDY